MTKYVIVGRPARGPSEDIDEFDSMTGAELMIAKYQMAFHGWALWVELRK